MGVIFGQDAIGLLDPLVRGDVDCQNAVTSMRLLRHVLHDRPLLGHRLPDEAEHPLDKVAVLALDLDLLQCFFTGKELYLFSVEA
jgi:hypothetical protein